MGGRAQDEVVRTIWITPKGQATAQRAQPVHPGASCSSACFGPQPFGPVDCNHSTRGGQTATHRPHPVQRGASMRGRAAAGMVRSLRRADGHRQLPAPPQGD